MKVITATGSDVINEKLKENTNYIVVGKDIIYQDGIFEILEIIQDINMILISDNLPGDYTIEELIKKIREKYEKIEIIVFLEKYDEYKVNFLSSLGIYKIYDLNNLNMFYKFLGQNSVEDIQKFKKSLYERINNSIIENNFYLDSEREEKTKKTLDSFKYKSKRAKIIVFDGNPGSGKSIIACLVSEILSNRRNRILLTCINTELDSIKTVLGIKKENSINKFRNFDVFIYEPIKQEYNNEFLKSEEYTKVRETYNSMTQNYDYIIVDIENRNNLNYEYIRFSYEYADKIIYICESNLIGIAKTKKYLENNKEAIRKIKLLINKVNRYQINNYTLISIFKPIQIIGKIKYDENFDKMINKNFNRIVETQEYDEIINRIIE